MQFLGAMLYEADFWRPGAPRPPIEEALAEHRLARYLSGWGRLGDRAVVAVDPSGAPVGAAWYRLFPPDAPGYGFVDQAIPVLTVAVATSRRGRGVGTELMRALIRAARHDGFAALSLSVEPDNPAARLYERLGFERVGRFEGAHTMLLRL